MTLLPNATREMSFALSPSPSPSLSPTGIDKKMSEIVFLSLCVQVIETRQFVDKKSLSGRLASKTRGKRRARNGFKRNAWERERERERNKYLKCTDRI